MLRTTRIAVLVSAVVAGATCAQEPERSPRQVMAEELEHTTIPLDFKDAHLGEVIVYLADLTPLNYVVAPFTDVEDQRITLSAPDAPLREALDVLCEAFRPKLKLSDVNGVVYFYRRGREVPKLPKIPDGMEALSTEKVTLGFRETPAKDVAAFLAEASGLEVTCAPTARSVKVSMRLRDVSVATALTLICDQVGLALKLEDGAVRLERAKRK